MLPTDVLPPMTGVLHRIDDRRVRQCWDPAHLVAERMKADARPPQPEQECCVRSGILWDLAAVYPAGQSWGDRMPAAVHFNGPVADVVGAVTAALTSH